MRFLTRLLLLLLVLAAGFTNRAFAQSASDRAALEKTTEAIRSAFARGDVAAVVALHHPGIKKWFGADNVVADRVALATGLAATFRMSRLEFVENQTESLFSTGDTAIKTSVFTSKSTPKNGNPPTLAHGWTMVA